MDDKHRCGWVNEDPLYIRYHDEEWGVPVRTDRKMFEFLLLETFQAGLSWYTILRKREAFRSAFEDFNYHKIAAYGDEEVQRLMTDEGIIRNRQKIEASINNAQVFMQVQKAHGSFCNFLWEYVNHLPIQNRWKNTGEVPATTPLSDRLSSDLKKLGFKFVGSTTVYAHMQAAGLVNDHTLDCFRHEKVRELGTREENS